MEFIAGVNGLHQMLQWIEEQLKPMGFKSAILHRVELASEEALVNIFHHAYQGRSEKVEILVQTFPKSHAEIVFIDRGPFFNPLNVSPIKENPSLEQREVGGLGIQLMRQCIDEIRYARKQGKNWLTFVIFTRSSQKR